MKLQFFRVVVAMLLVNAAVAEAGEPIKRITSFEGKNPFTGGTVVGQHASDGEKALRIDASYVSMEAAQDWTGYDYIMADVHTDAKSRYACCKRPEATGLFTTAATAGLTASTCSRP